MKESNHTMSLYKIKPYIFTVVTLLLAACFCIVFFVILKDLPDNVPVHWSAQVGFDKWGSKSELYGIGIIPVVFSAITALCSFWLIGNKFKGFSYFANGLSLFVTVIMVLVAALMLWPVIK